MIDRRALLGLAAALALPVSTARAAGSEIAYGSDPAQRLDLHARPGLKDAPVLLWVHGGGWSIGDKSRVNALPQFAERHGLLLASANYRMAPQVDAGGCAEDVASAAAWIAENAARHGGDPRRIFLGGHSAGAHLAALVGVDPQYLGARGLKPSDLAGVIPVDGAGYDAPRQMSELGEAGGPIRKRLSGKFEDAFGNRAAALSPTLLVRSGQDYPPFLIFHVERRADAREQSNGLAEALRKAGGRAEVVSASGETHMSINRDFGNAGDPEGERAARFIKTGAL